MAEYAGLEIRIGGNTTKLNNALKASTKSAAELQRNIRQVTKAMQFDPTDLRNIETRIKLTGDRMESLQSKAKLMATSMKQLGDSVVTLDGTPKTIRQIASETDNLTLTAKQADERYVNMTDSLAGIYDAWNKITREEGVDLARKLGIDSKTARDHGFEHVARQDALNHPRHKQGARGGFGRTGVRPSTRHPRADCDA